MSQKIAMNMSEALNAAFAEDTTPAAPKSNARVQSQVYLNAGMKIQGADGETVFASLPFGIPIDTQEAKALTTSPKLNHSIKAGNDLLAALQAKAEKIAPGEAVTVNLQLELRKRKSTDVTLDNVDDAVIDIAALFG